MKKFVSLTVVLMLLAVLPAGLMAEKKETSITPFAGVMVNGSSEFTIGGIFDYELGDGLFLEAEGGMVFSETWLFGGAGIMYQFNLKNSPIKPFIVAGGGIHYVSVDVYGVSVSDTTFKLNAGGGIKFLVGKGIKLRAEFRAYFLDGSFNRIMGGIEIPL